MKKELPPTDRVHCKEAPKTRDKQTLNQHQKRTGDDAGKAQRRFLRELFVKDNVGKQHRHEDAQLVDRDDDARRAVLQRLVVAQPASAGGEPRQADEAQLALRDAAQRALFARDEHHQPRHHEHDARADGRPEVRLHARDADLAEDGGQAGEHGGEDGIEQPALSFGLVFGDCFFLDHQERADGDEHDGRALEPGDALAQEEERQRDRQDGA